MGRTELLRMVLFLNPDLTSTGSFRGGRRRSKVCPVHLVFGATAALAIRQKRSLRAAATVDHRRGLRRSTRLPIGSGSRQCARQLKDLFDRGSMKLAKQSSWPPRKVLPFARGRTASSGGALSARPRVESGHWSLALVEDQMLGRHRSLRFERVLARTAYRLDAGNEAGPMVRNVRVTK